MIVRVADAAGKPVAGAAVEVATDNVPGAVDPGTTDDRGAARLSVPADAQFRGVMALKDGVGVHSFSNLGVEPPAEVALTLRGSRTITLRALDSAGRPIPGVAFRLRDFTPKERLFSSSPSLPSPSRITEVTTDAAGLARWRWVPEECSGEVVVVPPAEDLGTEWTPRLSHFSEGRPDPDRPAPAQGPALRPGRPTPTAPRPGA